MTAIKRVEAVNDLIKQGLITVSDARKLLEFPPNPWGDMKPEGLKSGEAIRQLDNVVFQKNPFLQRRTGCVPVVYGGPEPYLKYHPGYDAVVKLDRGCNHTWKHYQGFTECYEYCTKCNEKRD